MKLSTILILLVAAIACSVSLAEPNVAELRQLSIRKLVRSCLTSLLLLVRSRIQSCLSFCLLTCSFIKPGRRWFRQWTR